MSNRNGESRAEREMNKVMKLVLTGLMTALVTVATMALPIPIPGTTGYINLGDGIIFLSVFVLGWRYAAFAGGVGAGLADVLLGAAVWSPWTLVIKAGMAVIAGLLFSRRPHHISARVWSVLSMVPAVLWMVAGYYAAEGVIYGNWAAPIVGLPWNLIQGAVGICLAAALGAALEKTSARKYFANKI